MIINISLDKINLLYKLNNKLLYFILGNDFFLIKKIKYIILNSLNNKEKINIKNIYIYNSLDLLDFINFNSSCNIFFDKEVIVVNLIKLENLNLLVKYKNNIFLNKNIVFIFIKHKFESFNEKIIIFKILNEFNSIFIKILNLSYKDFLFLIKNKNNSFILKEKIYSWLYLIYKDNFLSILKILNYIINTKNLKFNFKKLGNFIISNKEICINYKSWIFLSLLGYKKLSNLNLFIIKNKNYDEINTLLIFLQKCIFVLIFKLKNNNKNNICYYLRYYNINLKYKNIFLKSLNKLKIEDLFNVLKIMCDIEIYIKKYNCIDKDIIWNKFNLISLYLNK